MDAAIVDVEAAIIEVEAGIVGVGLSVAVVVDAAIQIQNQFKKINYAVLFKMI